MGMARTLVLYPRKMVFCTCVEALDAFFSPDGFEGVGEMGVLEAVVAMGGRCLARCNFTSMLSLVLAISKGLQIVTDMKPPNSPATKFTKFWLFKILCLSVITIININSFIISNYIYISLTICMIPFGWASLSPYSSASPSSVLSNGLSIQVALD